MLEHLGRCPACFDVVAAVTRSAREPEVARWPVLLRLAVAAVLLAGIGVAVWLASGGRGGKPGAAPSTREALVSLAARLSAEDPDLFRSFQPLSADELSAESVERGGFIVTSPRGRVSGDTISLGWQAVAGATEYDAVVQDEEGKVVTGVLTEQTSEVLRAAVPWREPFPEDHGPALPPGRYVVEVTAHAPVVEKARSAFEVASPEQVARLERALGAIAARADRALAPLAQAHYALREGWLERARALSDEAASARPNDPEVEVLRRHIAARMGTR